MRVYLYGRVSTDKQELAQQEKTVLEWVSAHNMQIDEVVTDEGISGGVSYVNRNLGKILIPKLQAGDLLIVSEISRLGRSMFDLSKLINTELKQRKIRLVVVSMGIDLDCNKMTAIDQLILSNFAFAAQLEKELTQSRTKAGLDARRELLKKNGGWMSKAGNWTTGFGSPRGIRRSSSSGDANAIARQSEIGMDADRHKQYDLMQNLRTRGDTMQAIAATLNSLGYPAPRGGTWQAGQVSRGLSEWGKYFN